MSALKKTTNRLKQAAVAAYLGLLSSPALAAVQPEADSYDMPRDVSLHGHRIDWLIEVTMVFLVILFVIMVVWMGIAIFKHGENHEAEYDHGHSKHHVMFALGLSAVIFLIVDGNLWVNSLKDLYEVFWNFDDSAAEDTVQVEVNAHQWAWDFRYKGPDGKFNTADDIVVLNDLRVPVDTNVHFQMASSDVIHSFNLPNLRIKQDVVPGNVTPMWVHAVETGEFDIACAQHCGAHHYKMKGKITVMSQEDFAVWEKEASIRAQAAYNPDDIGGHWGWTWKEI